MEKITYDDILPLIGDFKRHQWKLYMLIILPSLNTFFKLGVVFMMATPKYSFWDNTVLRTAGMGMNAIAGAVGSMIAPFVFCTVEYWEFMPNIVLATLLFLAGISCLLLPESFARKLPETLEEEESFEN